MLINLVARTFVAIALSTVHGSRRIRAFSADPRTEQLVGLARQVAAGAVRPVVHGTYPLADIAAAHAAFELGGVLGKHVVTVG